MWTVPKLKEPLHAPRWVKGITWRTGNGPEDQAARLAALPAVGGALWLPLAADLGL